MTLVLATVLAGTVALAGCTTGSPPGSSSRSAAASASASLPPFAHAAFTIPTTCLSAAEVSALLGIPEYSPTVSASSGSLVCEYLTASEDGSIIDCETKPGISPSTLAAGLASNPPDGSTVTAVSGLGDAAYEVQSRGVEGIMILTGSTLINIAGGATTLPRVESLAVDVLAG